MYIQLAGRVKKYSTQLYTESTYIVQSAAMGKSDHKVGLYLPSYGRARSLDALRSTELGEQRLCELCGLFTTVQLLDDT